MAAVPHDLSTFGRPAADVRIAQWAATPRPQLGPFGAECAFTEEEQAIVDTLRRFAEHEMRPTGEVLDRMPPDEVIAPNSPLWSFYAKFGELGFTVDLLLGMEPLQRAKIMCLFYEILGWGDSGLAISIGAGTLPRSATSSQAPHAASTMPSRRARTSAPDCPPAAKWAHFIGQTPRRIPQRSSLHHKPRYPVVESNRRPQN